MGKWNFHISSPRTELARDLFELVEGGRAVLCEELGLLWRDLQKEWEGGWRGIPINTAASQQTCSPSLRSAVKISTFCSICVSFEILPILTSRSISGRGRREG